MDKLGNYFSAVAKSVVSLKELLIRISHNLDFIRITKI